MVAGGLVGGTESLPTMQFVVKNSMDHFFGPFTTPDEAADWARRKIISPTQWVIVPVWPIGDK